MEPKSSPGASEHLPNPIEYGQYPTEAERRPELRVEQSREQVSLQRDDSQLAAAQQAQSVQLPAPVAVPQQDDSTSQNSDDNPASAADDDLIEKEWVDKAKKIINDTREDPHKRELEVNKLQADYLKKRYGKELGNSL